MEFGAWKALVRCTLSPEKLAQSGFSARADEFVKYFTQFRGVAYNARPSDEYVPLRTDREIGRAPADYGFDSRSLATIHS